MSANLNSHATTSLPNNANANLLSYQLIVLLVAALIFLVPCFGPPHLMDDVDAVQAQIARTMLETGDWVTPKLNGIAYMEKPVMKYWLIATAFAIFGVHDWAARLPLALLTITLCVVLVRFGAWAFSPRIGFYSGLVLATSIGLFLFTRILIADASVTCMVTIALWSVMRALDDDTPLEKSGRWIALAGACAGFGILLKGLIAAVFPSGALFFYLVASGRLWQKRTWQRLHPVIGLGSAFLLAAPWHALAIWRNPPYFDFTLYATPGIYRGFFWSYFINEHVLRFLNRRYPRDYNTVPRALFWLLHLVWLFPWSVYFPALTRLKFSWRPTDRAGHVRLLALCWISFVMFFFSLSTTQEYYSMPMYPALALLLGSALDSQSRLTTIGSYLGALITTLAALAIGYILLQVWSLPTPGDIATALAKQTNSDIYTLSLGHMGDLTLESFAYLRVPLVLAGVAFLIGTAGVFYRGQGLSDHLRQLLPTPRLLTSAMMMVLFFTAARIAMITFDPYLGSYPLAAKLRQSPPGELFVDNQYYLFSSVFFYGNIRAKLVNGRVNNLEYASYAPGAPNVFATDEELKTAWLAPNRCYLFVEDIALPRIEKLVGKEKLIIVAQNGGKFLITNQLLTTAINTP
jgi:4-amino-4-deoxy-L-arabinose transferase-like glycosyltransferase